MPAAARMYCRPSTAATAPAMVGVVAISYVVETIIVKPNWGDVLYHAVVPSFSGSESVLLAAGIKALVSGK